MEKKGIYARFFGNYGLKYGDEQLILEHSSTSKTAQLLQMLLYFHKTGIPRYRLLENLVGQEERANPINNLKGALSRLRKLLGETILPDMECIVAQNGIYSWTQEIPVTTDVEEFEQLLDQADNTVMDDDKALELRVQACDLYKGELLPQLINLEWVSVENTRLKERYDQTVRYVCAQLTAKGEIRRALELYEKAATVYPFEEEWQVGRLDCMLNLGQHKNALQVYQDVVDANYRNLGISPSEEMQDCFRRIREGAAWGFSSVQEVQKNLMESHIGGAYFCSYPCFASVYQMVRRLIGRNGQLILFYALYVTYMECPSKRRNEQPQRWKRQLLLLKRIFGAAISSRSTVRTSCWFFLLAPIWKTVPWFLTGWKKLSDRKKQRMDAK